MLKALFGDKRKKKAQRNAGAAPAGFPKPQPEKHFPELKVYDSRDNPWRAAAEDWAGAQARAGEPAWAAWVGQQRSVLAAWMARHRTDSTAWRAGWAHEFISPADSTALAWEDSAAPPQSFKTARSGDAVAATPKLQAAWVCLFRAKHAEMVVLAARLWRLLETSDSAGAREAAEWAADQLDFYAANLREWEVNEKEGGRLFWQSLDEATNCLALAEAARLLDGYAGAARRHKWLDGFFRPTVALLARFKTCIHNIAVWHRAAQAAVGLVFGDKAVFEQAIDGEWGLEQQLDEGVTSDFLWLEQSLPYNAYVVQAVLPLFTLAGLVGRADDLEEEMGVVQNLMLAPIYIRMPDGTTPNPADSRTRPVAPDTALLAQAYRVFPTHRGSAAAAGRRNWDVLVDPPQAALAAAAEPALPVVQSVRLESSRMALLSAGGWAVFVHVGQLVKSHAEAEALNFTCYYGTTDVSHDAGTVSYGSPLHAGYFTQGLAHNVPLVDGEGQEPPQRGEIVSFSATAVTARQPKYASGVSVERTVRIEGKQLVDHVAVTTTDGKTHRLGLALHLQGELTPLPAGFVGDTTLDDQRPGAFKFWKDPVVSSFAGVAELPVRFASGLKVLVTLRAPGRMRVWHASTPDTPLPARRQSLYVELGDAAKAAEFTTTLTPLDD